MDPLQNPYSFGEPVEEDVEPNTEERESSKSGASSEAAAAAQELMAPIDMLVSEENSALDPQDMIPPLEVSEENTDENPSPGNPEEDVKPTSDEPFMEWVEPIEDDKERDEDEEDDDDAATSLDKNEQDEESEESESITGSEKTTKKISVRRMPRRKSSRFDEEWIDWPGLGEGWKRKEVIRRSGNSMGQTDVYYMSPQGSRVRSRVELLCHFKDLPNFDYKTGVFLNNYEALEKTRGRHKRKRKYSSSESSLVDRVEGSDNPDSSNGSQVSKNLPSNQTGTIPLTTIPTPNQGFRSADAPGEDKIKLPLPSSSNRPLRLPSINGEIGTEDSTLVCAKCGFSFTGTWYDKQRKRPCCPTCWASKTKEHPMIRFRKWIPCGQCVGCHNTVNCGQCANCKHGLQSAESRKRICRKRKCICPIRKTPGYGSLQRQAIDSFDDGISFESEVTDSQHQSHRSSDTENLTGNLDADDDDEEEDMSTDDDDDWHRKRKRRACGECTACLCRKDCGTCDFCIDKPKFGGSNKKRQKCRLRQCQRQAMVVLCHFFYKCSLCSFLNVNFNHVSVYVGQRHLLPFQLSEGEHGPDGTTLGRPRPHYTYSRKSITKKARDPQDVDTTDNDDDESNFSLHTHPLELSEQSPEPSDQGPHTSCHSSSEMDQPHGWDAEKPGTTRGGHNYTDEDDQADNSVAMPIITQIVSLADINDNNNDNNGNGSSSGNGNGSDTYPAMEKALFNLLRALRTSMLPQLWSAIMVEGPLLQLIQCSRQSKMTDTTVLIHPGFSFEVAVQKQPLNPSHRLYEKFPYRISTVMDVVQLLSSLEKYVLCQGVPLREPCSSNQPVLLERAATCDFLVRRKASICNHCRVALRIRVHSDKIKAASAL